MGLAQNSLDFSDYGGGYVPPDPSPPRNSWPSAQYELNKIYNQIKYEDCGEPSFPWHELTKLYNRLSTFRSIAKSEKWESDIRKGIKDLYHDCSGVNRWVKSNNMNDPDLFVSNKISRAVDCIKNGLELLSMI